MIQRVVFDTSTLVSAALREKSIPYQALVHALAACELCASTATLDELERVLTDAKFDPYVNRTGRTNFINLIHRQAHIFSVRDSEIASVKPSCRDKNDNQFLALAIIAGADIIVSSDKDLIVLNPWHEISIFTPSEFLSHTQSQSLP